MVRVKVEEVTSEKMASPGAFWESPGAHLEQPPSRPEHVPPVEEEAGRGESRGPQYEPTRIIKEEPQPLQETGNKLGMGQGGSFLGVAGRGAQCLA